jgi:hypothetical protein
MRSYSMTRLHLLMYNCDLQMLSFNTLQYAPDSISLDCNPPRLLLC